jgi:hypothetical protein
MRPGILDMRENATGGSISAEKGKTMAEPQSVRPWMDFEDEIAGLRKKLKECAEMTKALMNHPVFQSEPDGIRNDDEMKANIMLTYRHLEDAAMRLGKAIQAHDGGKSVYSR